MTVEINNKTKNKIDSALIERVAEKFLKIYKKEKKEVSVVFISESAIQRLNKIYRRVNKTTDVLTFAGDKKFLGEILINFKQIKRQAKELGVSAKKELIFILVHGLLHLLGFTDEAEKDRLEMIRSGEDFIKKLKLKK